MGNSSRSDTTGQELQENMTGRELKKGRDWTRAPGVTCIGKSSRSDTTGRQQCAAGNKKFAGSSSSSDTTRQEFQELHDWAKYAGVTRRGESITPLEIRYSPASVPGVTRMDKSPGVT